MCGDCRCMCTSWYAVHRLRCDSRNCADERYLAEIDPKGKDSEHVRVGRRRGVVFGWSPPFVHATGYGRPPPVQSCKRGIVLLLNLSRESVGAACCDCFVDARQLAQELPPTHPVRLGLKLNASVSLTQCFALSLRSNTPRRCSSSKLCKSLTERPAWLKRRLKLPLRAWTHFRFVRF